VEKSSDSRAASGAVVGLFLVLLICVILGLTTAGAAAAPGTGTGPHVGIVR
jgi:hypothetical protein